MRFSLGFYGGIKILCVRNRISLQTALCCDIMILQIRVRRTGDYIKVLRKIQRMIKENGNDRA